MRAVDSRFRGNDDIQRTRPRHRHSRESGNPLPVSEPRKMPRDGIRRSYPALTPADIDAALSYAAELTREGAVDLPLEINA